MRLLTAADVAGMPWPARQARTRRLDQLVRAYGIAHHAAYHATSGWRSCCCPWRHE